MAKDASAPAQTGDLSGINLLKSLNTGDLTALAQSCSWTKHKNGVEIIDRNSDCRDMYFVVAGRVRVVNYSLSGREVAYAILEAGDYFGEIAAIDGLPRSAHVVTMDPVILASLPPAGVRTLIENHPDIAIQIMEKLAAIIRNCDDRIMDLATLGAIQRVYRELIKLVKPDPVQPDSWLIYPMPTQAQIAALASTTRETVARVVSQLSSAGIVEKKSKTLYIREMEKLRTLAERTNPGNKDESETS